MKNKTVKIFLLFVVITAIIFMEVFVLKKTGKIEIIFGLNGAFAATILFFLPNGKLHNVLLFLYFASLLLLNNNIHYQFKYELILAAPLFLLAFYTLLILILNGSPLSKYKKVISKPVLLFVVFFFLMAIIGKIQGANLLFILYESYHFLLYLSIFVIIYNLTSRDDYHFIFYSLFFLFFLISLEYIVLGYVVSRQRFVTFQSGFLPLFSGILFAFILKKKNFTIRTVLFFVLLLSFLAMFSTLTRSLWVTTIITLGGVYFFYLIAEKKFTLSKKLILAAAIISSLFVLLYLAKNFKSADAIQDNSKSVEQRVESIKNPTEDHSFLMRVELGWYALQKFISRPVLGWGLGDYLRYKFLGDPALKNIYLDNSWFYILWKGGLIGFILITYIFFRVFKTGLFILKNTDNVQTQIYVIGILGGFIGLIALGLLSPLLIKYRSNVLIAFLWAYIEFEYNSLKQNESNNE